MGQAKNRGTQEQRVALAQARQAALRPPNLVCGNCKAEVTEFQALDSRGLPGIEAVFGGQCPQCGENVIAAKGDREAVTSMLSFYAEQIGAGDEATFGMQTADGKPIPLKA